MTRNESFDEAVIRIIRASIKRRGRGEGKRQLFGLTSISLGHLPLQFDANCPTGSGFGNRVQGNS